VTTTRPTPFGLPRMRARDPKEPNRVASSLELFFDLTVVVAVSIAAEQLLRYEEAGRTAAGVGAYGMVFFAIWWAWMNFTWFASAFDTDDWFYRVLTIVQMGGVLVLAAGVEPAMWRGDYTVATLGYVLMRLAMLTQWIRAARATEFRSTALRYAIGVGVVQAAWLLRLALPPETGVVSFLLLVVAELAVPLLAERAGITPFHPHHIAERYGLFTLIVLGEGLLSVTHAIARGVGQAERFGPVLVIGASALVLIAAMWWTYFAREQHGRLRSFSSTFAYGYLHYLVFAAAGALPAGIEVAVAEALGDEQVGPAAGRALTTVPVALFLLGVWIVSLRPALSRGPSAIVLVLVAAIALSALVPQGVPLAALLAAGLVFVLERDRRHTP
jgi:low temperature requirement protein LtrA